MKRLYDLCSIRIALALFVIGVACIGYSQAQMIPLTGAGGKFRASVVLATKWDSVNKGGSITLSNNDLTAAQGGAGSFMTVRSLTSYSTGKKFYQITIDAFASNLRCGIANASFPLDTTELQPNDGAAIVFDTGVILPSSSGYDIGSPAVSDIVGIAIDFDTMEFWGKLNALDWNGNASSNPATGSLGQSLAVLNAGPFFAACTTFQNDTVTANFGATAYANGGAPSGFGNF